jgi:5-methylcytosine-specific restriction endonuclease McrA
MATFDEYIIEQVWQKASKVQNNAPNIYRKDYAGAWIRRDQYGKQTEYGWEIDHLNPVSNGGSDDLSNLFPLQWKNNLSKSDNYPDWFTSQSAAGVHNVNKSQGWTIKQR